MPFVAIVGMSAMAFASPAIALIEYDQKNEHPQLTPEGLKLLVTAATISATLARYFDRRKMEHAFQSGGTPSNGYAGSYHKHLAKDRL